MKHLALISLCSLVLFSCAAKNTKLQNIKIAEAIKKEGEVFQSQGNYTAALAKFLEAEKTIPNDPYLQNSLGLAYMGKKRYDLAETAFNKAIALKPDYSDAKNNLGANYLRQGHWDKAIDKFKLVLEDLIYPTPHFPLTNLGWAHMETLNYSQAQRYFLKALDEKPRFVAAVHGLAQVFLKTGQTDRAVDYLHRNLRKIPDAAILHADLAQAYEAQKKIPQAIKAWQLVLKLVPETSSLARQAESRLSELQ